MKKLLFLAVSLLGLVACGPGAKITEGKQGAAEALYAASLPTKAGADRAATPIDLTGAVKWNCPEGGSAEITGFSVNIGLGTGTSVSQSINLQYNGCGLAKSDVGVAVYNGTLQVSQKVLASSSGAAIEQSFKGKVLVQGAFDDFLDADVTQSVQAGALGTSGAGVAMTLKGTVANSSGSYAFDESVSVTAGRISATLPTKK